MTSGQKFIAKLETNVKIDASKNVDKKCCCTITQLTLTKGQKISKANYGLLNSPKKGTKYSLEYILFIFWKK